MKTPLGSEVDLGPCHIVIDGVPASAKGAQQPLPLFGPCLLWPRSPISATAELLFINNDRLTDERTDGRIIAISVALCIAVLHQSAIKISLLEAIDT